MFLRTSHTTSALPLALPPHNFASIQHGTLLLFTDAFREDCISSEAKLLPLQAMVSRCNECSYCTYNCSCRESHQLVLQLIQSYLNSLPPLDMLYSYQLYRSNHQQSIAVLSRFAVICYDITIELESTIRH